MDGWIGGLDGCIGDLGGCIIDLDGRMGLGSIDKCFGCMDR